MVTLYYRYNAHVVGVVKRSHHQTDGYGGKVENKESFIAFDGSIFFNKYNCEKYEALFNPEEYKPTTMEQAQYEHAMRIFKMCEGNRTKASEILGISRSSLWRIIKSK